MINKTLRRLAVGASAITVLGVVVPLAAATSASAAEATGITATPSTQTVSEGSTATYTATLTPAGNTSTNGVDYAITAGPSNVALSGTECDTGGAGTNTGAGPFPCAVDTTGFTAGTYTVTIFDDVANTGSYQTTDPHTTVSLIVAGTESAYTVTPATTSAAQNICVAYSGTAKDANGTAAVGQTVPLTATQATTTAQDGTTHLPNGPAFCTPTSTTFADATPHSTQTGTTPAFTDTATSTATVASDGTFTFGLKSDLTGTVNITVGGTQSSTNNPASATLTVTNGTATTNTQAVNNDVAGGLTVTPTSQNAVAGSDATYAVTVTNSSGQVIGGVLPSYVITSGADKTTAPIACDAATNNKGATTCTISTSTATTDAVTTYVEQDDNAPNNATGPNAGEPQANSTLTVGAALLSPVITDSCGGSSAPTTGTCNAAASAASQTVTFTLKSNNSGGTSVAAAGQTVSFSTTTGTYTLSATSAVTDANGQVSVTVSHTAGTVENGNVKATFDNGGTAVTDTPAVDFVASTATALNLTPQNQTKAVGSQVTVTATATNALKAGVAGDVIKFTVKGPRNSSTTNAGAVGYCTTAADGSCTFSYTDTGVALTGTGTAYDQIGAQDTTASITTTSDAGHASNAPGAATAGSDATVTFVAGTATASAVTLTDSNTGHTNGAGTANTQPAGTTTGPADNVIATVNDANGNPLANDTVTFTLTGVGNFVDAQGNSLGTSTTVATAGNGTASVGVTSTTPGTQAVTATADGVSSNPFTITYTNASYNPVTPIRLIDSRNGTGNLQTNSNATAAQGPLAPNTPYKITLSNTAGSFLNSGNTQGIVVNVAAIDASGVGNLRIAPNTGGSAPSTGVLSYQPGKDVSNGLVLPYATSYTVYSDTASANFTMDLEGYYTDGFIGTNPPVRVANTLTGNGGTVASGTSRAFQISGVNGDGVPTGAKAVAINVTAVNPSGLGNLRVYPDGQSVPGTANISYIAHQDKSAFVVVPLPANGKIDVYSDGSSANVIVDVFGYYPSVVTSGINPTNLTFLNSSGAPVRVLAPTAIAANTPYNVTVAGTNGIPANAQAVVVSIAGVHAANSTGVGNLRAYPAGAGVPNAAVLDYVSKTADVANFAIVKIGTNGQISLYSDGSPIKGVVDVFGYIPAGS